MLLVVLAELDSARVILAIVMGVVPGAVFALMNGTLDHLVNHVASVGSQTVQRMAGG